MYRERHKLEDRHNAGCEGEGDFFAGIYVDNLGIMNFGGSKNCLYAAIVVYKSLCEKSWWRSSKWKLQWIYWRVSWTKKIRILWLHFIHNISQHSRISVIFSDSNVFSYFPWNHFWTVSYRFFERTQLLQLKSNIISFIFKFQSIMKRGRCNLIFSREIICIDFRKIAVSIQTNDYSIIIIKIFLIVRDCWNEKLCRLSTGDKPACVSRI